MASLDQPQIRPLSVRVVEQGGEPFVQFEDSLGLTSTTILVPTWLCRHVLSRFDGKTGLRDVQATVLRETGQLVTTDDLTRLVEQLDEALILDGPGFAAYREE